MNTQKMVFFILIVIFCMSFSTICVALDDDSSGSIMDEDFISDQQGGVSENLGEGEYETSEGTITEVDSMGSGEYRTSGGDIIEDTGAGEYVEGGDEDLRGMDE
ncbi:MAG: hypothetical protein PHW46_04210 [Candidatus Omnitrophica bacterium]|nr:hypothetical protein [Candidatus Omnitrophota bacterium]